MDLGIAGKWALVGGASKGLGMGCAQALLREFGSLAVLFNAAPEEIDRAIPKATGAGAVIAAARECTQEAMFQMVSGSPVRSNDAALHRYLQSRLGRLPEEHLHVVFV